MWALFTRALTAHTSATRVSIINTSANFLVTAFLGWVIFGEKLGGLWFLGAAFLGVGNVVIGRKTGSEEKKDGIDGRGAGEGIGGEEQEGEEEVGAGVIKLGDQSGERGREDSEGEEEEGSGEWDALLEEDVVGEHTKALRVEVRDSEEDEDDEVLLGRE